MILINQQEAVEGVKELFSLGDCFCDEYSIVGMLNSLPTQKIVHCENCEHWDTSWETVHGLHYCPMIDIATEKNFFCKYGVEKKGNLK